MNTVLLQIAAFAIPALIGVAAAALVGAPQVRQLRRDTGDNSALTYVLSGDFLRRGQGRSV